jgi:hypothetical protein
VSDVSLHQELLAAFERHGVSDGRCGLDVVWAAWRAWAAKPFPSCSSSVDYNCLFVPDPSGYGVDAVAELPQGAYQAIELFRSAADGPSVGCALIYARDPDWERAMRAHAYHPEAPIFDEMRLEDDDPRPLDWLLAEIERSPFFRLALAKAVTLTIVFDSELVDAVATFYGDPADRDRLPDILA